MVRLTKMASKTEAASKGKSTKQANSSNTKLQQNDLRRLMKEKQAASAASKKIDSPLAKYNNIGELICVLCNSKIKNALLWTAHVNGKGHKDNLAKLKKKEDSSSSVKNSQNINSTNQQLKRTLKIQEDGPPVKKTKSVTPPSPPSKKSGLRVSFSLSDDEEETTEKEPEVTPALPPDFFDNENKSNSNKDAESSEPKVVSKSNSSNTTALPEGFFDDPVKDAKVRKVEYKDPMDDEWDKFQKAISEASSISQNMMDENDEDMKTEREIDEIDEQIHNWARVEALLQRKDQTRKSNEVTSEDVEMEELPDNDDEDVDELLNWRSKGGWR